MKPKQAHIPIDVPASSDAEEPPAEGRSSWDIILRLAQCQTQLYASLCSLSKPMNTYECCVRSGEALLRLPGVFP